MTEHDYIRQMFTTLNNNVLSLDSKVDSLSRELAEQKGESTSFRREVLRHFDSCPVDELREHTGQIDIELERIRAKKKSDDKISRPPPAERSVSDRTIQLLIVLAVIALGGIGLVAQMVTP
jgi:hypothetical protein